MENIKYMEKVIIKKTNNERFEIIRRFGVFLIVLECIIEKLAQKIISKSNIPIIGIGASKDCHGQILVVEDLLGLTDFESKFLKKYVNLKTIIADSLSKYSKEVKEKKYPKLKHLYKE